MTIAVGGISVDADDLLIIALAVALVARGIAATLKMHRVYVDSASLIFRELRWDAALIVLVVIWFAFWTIRALLGFDPIWWVRYGNLIALIIVLDMPSRWTRMVRWIEEGRK